MQHYQGGTLLTGVLLIPDSSDYCLPMFILYAHAEIIVDLFDFCFALQASFALIMQHINASARFKTFRGGSGSQNPPLRRTPKAPDNS